MANKFHPRKIKGIVEDIQGNCTAFLAIVNQTGNQDAYTDSILEEIIEKAEALKSVYESQFEN